MTWAAGCEKAGLASQQEDAIAAGGLQLVRRREVQTAQEGGGNPEIALGMGIDQAANVLKRFREDGGCDGGIRAKPEVGQAVAPDRK